MVRSLGHHDGKTSAGRACVSAVGDRSIEVVATASRDGPGNSALSVESPGGMEASAWQSVETWREQRRRSILGSLQGTGRAELQLEGVLSVSSNAFDSR